MLISGLAGGVFHDVQDADCETETFRLLQDLQFCLATRPLRLTLQAPCSGLDEDLTPTQRCAG